MKFELLRKYFEKAMNRNLFSRTCLILGFQIFTICAIILILMTLQFFLNLNINQLILPISFVLSVILIYFCFFKGKLFKHSFSLLLPAILILVVYVASFFIANHFFDVSWDGQEYHQGVVFQVINEGFNPIKDVLDYSYNNLWIQHYAKGSELLASSVYAITQNIESGKMFNILLIFGSFSLALGTFLSEKRLSIWYSLLLAFVIAFNPISVYQSLSYYLDGQLMSSIIAMFFAGYLLLKEKSLTFLVLWFALEIILVNLKFTGVLFAITFCIGFLTILVLQKDKKFLKLTCISMLIVGIIAVFAVGFNPYVRNLKDYGSPVYPLTGELRDNIILWNTPSEMVGIGRIKQFLVGQFILKNEGEELIPRAPFILDENQLLSYKYADTRIGGFGPYFMEISILAAILGIILLFQKKKHLKYLIVIVFVCIIPAIIVSKEAWWARYVPTLYILPLFIMVYSFLQNHKSFIQKFLLLLFLMNTLVISYIYIQDNITSTQEVHNTIQTLKEAEQPITIYFPSVKDRNVVNKFYENDIQFEIVSDEEVWKSVQGKSTQFYNTSMEIKYNLDNPE